MSESSRRIPTVISFAIFVTVLVVLTFSIRMFIVAPYQVPTESMETTIATGDMILAEKVTHNFANVKPGDIIVFQDPQDSERTLVKRVIATSGQTIDLQDGKVYVDGVQLNESYTHNAQSRPLSATVADIDYPLTVPDGYIWVMGDNREHSQDSRYFGCVDENTVYGHVVLKYWPIEHFGLLN